MLLIKLDHYRNELLLNIGESEAYKELYVDSPELADELQPQYDNAKDNNTRILGKIRAIEGLLKQHEVLKQM
ncbi:DNA polymerase IV [Alteromonadales bacterium TW-7]|nr:DNA polymerase IV [Alteromonadales bacterium TW-7]